MQDVTWYLRGDGFCKNLTDSKLVAQHVGNQA